ncbi:hypothetical protein KAR91_01540 [Candidatus Pacearchaeota archaeon]|nr:hypothetical protein [Candidatus Pacearchaeota archaeon]
MAIKKITKKTTKKLPIKKLKDTYITVDGAADIYGVSRPSMNRWAKESGSPFAKKNGKMQSRLQDVSMWMVSREKNNSIIPEQTIPEPEERTLATLEELEWREAFYGSPTSRVKAINDLREIMIGRGDDLPDTIIVRLGILKPEDHIIESDEVIDSVHNLPIPEEPK